MRLQELFDFVHSRRHATTGHILAKLQSGLDVDRGFTEHDDPGGWLLASLVFVLIQRHGLDGVFIALALGGKVVAFKVLKDSDVLDPGDRQIEPTACGKPPEPPMRSIKSLWPPFVK